MINITIQEIDREIRRLKALKEEMEKKELPEYKQYVGKLYKHMDGSIGKITDARFKEGKVRFKGQSLWFDEEYYSITNEEDGFDFREFEIITEDVFKAIFDSWTKEIILSYGIGIVTMNNVNWFCELMGFKFSL